MRFSSLMALSACTRTGSNGSLYANGDCGPDKAGCSGYRGGSALNPIGSQKKSIINEESDQAAKQYAQDGAEAFPEGEGVHADENEDAHVIDEVVMVHHHDGHRGD